ncbi:MAG TPA: carboxylesterase family protein [Bacteroidales bacterium]|nr:carboxylesterase family protein [Bacteroidales bacterium]
MKSNRRNFIRTMGAGATGLALGTSVSSCSSAAIKKDEEDGQVLFIGDDIAVAETQYGKVRGYQLRGIFYFLGIPYGADTSGPNRFMPPQRPQPWTDIFPAVWWGNTAPQVMEKRYANSYASWADHWNYDDVSEDCLRLNIFTPAISDGKKRPVMFWLHGGGFTNGNGIEQDGYNGENFARKADVVFVSINHRLGPLGFTNLAGAGGEKFAASGNVGMLDCVAALEWVRDNIANFGGDPGNVTIMGQSGGGAKVTTLTAMPAAKGLIHKAVVLSGAGVKSGEKEYSEKLGAYVLKEAGLKPDEIEKLQAIPWLEYIGIANKAAARLAEESGPAAGGMRRGFNPVVDGAVLPQHPYFPDPSPSAADVPMLICSTMNESAPSRTDARLESVTLDEVKEKIKGRSGFSQGMGDKAAEVVDAYSKAFPDKKPVEIWSMITSNRQGVVTLADAKSKQQAPVYVAWFCWQPPLFDNRMRAFHCSDISHWYYNTDLMLSHTGGGSRPRKLSEKMSGALAQFMRTGNPDNGGLPAWSKYSVENGEVMVLDDVPELKFDPDREARKSLPLT